MKVAIYARYSSEDQSAASIDDQVRICMKYAQEREWVVTHVYSDEAVSGTIQNRPQFQQLLIVTEN